jgi:hypothetical protein
MRLNLIAIGRGSRSTLGGLFQNLLHDTAILGNGNIDESVFVCHVVVVVVLMNGGMNLLA